MTTLDRAFVKAFLNRDRATGAGEFPVRVVPLSEALEVLAGRQSDHGSQPQPLDKPMATVSQTSYRDRQPLAPIPGSPTVNSAAAPVATTPEPGLEVDHFLWPETCTRLEKAAGPQLDQVADAVADLLPGRGRVVAFGGCHRGEGATTLLLCTAERLAQRGMSMLLVDVDFDEAQLSRRLGLVAEHGWEEVLAGRLSLTEVVVQSSSQRTAVLPLRDPTAYTMATLGRLAEQLDVVRRRYDVVLLNLGPWDESRTPSHLLSHGIGRRLDLFILVQDVRSTTNEHREEVCAQLAVAGVPEVAVAENFAQA